MSAVQDRVFEWLRIRIYKLLNRQDVAWRRMVVLHAWGFFTLRFFVKHTVICISLSYP
jgi:hypothetical protein